MSKKKMVGFEIRQPKALAHSPEARAIYVKFEDGSEREYVDTGPEGAEFLRLLTQSAPARELPLRYKLERPVDVPTDSQWSPPEAPERLFAGVPPTGGVTPPAPLESLPADPEKQKELQQGAGYDKGEDLQIESTANVPTPEEDLEEHLKALEARATAIRERMADDDAKSDPLIRDTLKKELEAVEEEIEETVEKGAGD